jgi:hypothetical protein
LDGQLGYFGDFVFQLDLLRLDETVHFPQQGVGLFRRFDLGGFPGDCHQDLTARPEGLLHLLDQREIIDGEVDELTGLAHLPVEAAPLPVHLRHFQLQTGPVFFFLLLVDDLLGRAGKCPDSNFQQLGKMIK